MFSDIFRPGREPGRDTRDGRAFLLFAAIFLSAQLLGLHIMDAYYYIVGAYIAVPLYGAVPYTAMFLLPDFMLGLCAFRFLLSFQKPRFTAIVVCSLAISSIILASSIKYSVLGQSIVFDDLFLVSDLLVASSEIERIVVVAVPAGLLVLFLANFRLGAAPLLPSVLLLAFVGSGIAAKLHPAVSEALLKMAPLRLSSLPTPGHFATAWAHFIENMQHAHAMDGPREALPFDLISDAPAGIIGTRRNVYFILLESFSDPAWFPSYAWSREPLTDLFTRWRGAVGSASVSPTFGNGSTNVDFEIMCGLPSALGGSTVVFHQIPEGARLPCLPNFLAGHGYRTFSIVAEPPSFLNSDIARRGMGFQRTIFSPELDMTDRDGNWLSAEAMFRQALAINAEMRTRDGGAPILSHVFVTAGHLPYERNMSLRPDVIAMRPDDPIVRAWANGAHYNAAAATRYIEAVQQLEPDALIILVGDHNPVLGANFAGYHRGGRVPRGHENAPLRSSALYETPLLILDGLRMVDAGRLPAWQIPEIVIDILSEGRYCARRTCASTREFRIRPYFDFFMLLKARHEESLVCDLRGATEVGDGDARCAQGARHARALRQALARMLMNNR